MNAVTRIREAACSPRAQEALKGLVLSLASEGLEKDAIYQSFEEALLEVRAAHHGDESTQEDALLEVMDLLTGFCDPDLVLLPDPVKP